ncbi:MAG: lytic transglycosylase protein [Ferruginibacter sp.]|uniref:lytic transglycosylase domain-containing protein n=1 Tax=Ferruginibacter sp. TaxID=1940288 RepID=UPI002658CB2B|nr:lytic transglycosylase domain-containing protein [Ferruginibacter sp.]MDB5276980.1 lytic transglycosylase protein [Ferruginibacter sp.]
MKTTTIRREIGLLSMLVLLLFQAHTQPQTELLLAYLPHDSVTIKTTVNNQLAAIPLQPAVRKSVDQYLDENAEMLDIVKKQNTANFKTIRKVLLKSGLPAGLLYLAIVESELKNSATSNAGAAGIWQLMPETARTFGLKVNGKTDQRRDVYKSSVAVTGYFNELYKQFDDWLLVVAAYNCGAGKVYKAIKQSGSREFWKMQRFLPAETSAHVKHFIATHFYYEQNGSEVTLTKKERNKYLASLNDVAVKTTAAPSPATVDQPADRITTDKPAVELIAELKK